MDLSKRNILDLTGNYSPPMGYRNLAVWEDRAGGPFRAFRWIFVKNIFFGGDEENGEKIEIDHTS